MIGVFYDPQRSDEAWRQMIYNGGIIILSPPSEMLALVEHTRGMIEDAFASSLHARIYWTGSSWEIRDLGSRNGTYVNGAPLAAGSSSCNRATHFGASSPKRSSASPVFPALCWAMAPAFRTQAR